MIRPYHVWIVYWISQPRPVSYARRLEEGASNVSTQVAECDNLMAVIETETKAKGKI